MGEVFDNQIAYAQALAATVGETTTALVKAPYGLLGLPATLDTAVNQLSAGDFPGVLATVWNYAYMLDNNVTSTLLEAGIGPILTSMAANFASVIDVLPRVVTEVLDSPLYADGSTLAAFAATVQDIGIALGDGQYVAALSDVVNAPAIITGAFLNGFNGFAQGIGRGGGGGFHGGGYLFNLQPYGLLTYNPIGDGNGPYGVIANLLDARDRLVDAITPFTATGVNAFSTAGLVAVPHDLMTGLSGVEPTVALDLGQLPADVAGFMGALSADVGALLAALIP